MLRPLTRALTAASLMLGVAVAAAQPAAAVTFGSTVDRPSVTAAWVVSLYWSPTAIGVPKFVCTGSALSAQEVLTAAHCVEGPGFYFVKVRADRLAGGRLIPVEAISDHVAYGAQAMVNDIAVVRPMFSLGLRGYPRLATPAMVASIHGPRPPALTLFGWGQNQNRRLTGLLSFARLSPQTKAAKRLYGPTFLPALMIAAGRHIPATNTYAGACSGDSGAPLVMTVGTSPFITGVTSWGVGGCNVKAPTVFTSVGAYGTWVAAARRGLARRAVTDNRALPVLLTPVAIAGQVALGSALTCSPGAWSTNTRSVVPTWKRLDKSGVTTVLATGASYTVVAADADSTISCHVVARSAAGGTNAAASIVAIPAPTGYGNAVIAGIASYTSPGAALGVVATCTAPVYAQPEVATSYAWYLSANSLRTELGTGPALTMTEDLLRTLAGNTLVCVATSGNAMGSHQVSDYVTVSGLQRPSLTTDVLYGPGGFKAAEGAVSTCVTTTVAGASLTYRWGIESLTTYGVYKLDPTTTVLGTGVSYAFTAADVAAVKGRWLVCEATATSWQGVSFDLGRQNFS